MSLGDKLNGLELTEGEQHTLRALITGRGREAEVGGFGQRSGIKPVILGLEIEQTANWSTSGDADDRPTEEVAFYYNKIGF